MSLSPTYSIGDIVYGWSPKTPGKITKVRLDPAGYPGFHEYSIKWIDKTIEHKVQGRFLHSYADEIIRSQKRISEYKSKVKLGLGI